MSTQRLVALGTLLAVQAIAATDAIGAVYFIHADHLGSPRVVTNQSGTVVWRAYYDPFGKATITTQSVALNIRFPGQYFDSETGLHYNYFRDYDPQTGRYLQSDPIGLAAGLNSYAYVGNNPARFVDPSGLEISEEYHLVGPSFGFGKGGVIATGNYHSAVRITPCDQAQWANDPRFKNVDEQGRHYATAGAGPEFFGGFGNLIAGINRTKDLGPHSSIVLIEDKQGCECKQENEHIEKLLNLANGYQNSTPYSLFPEGGATPFYNSNSYTHGLLNAAGIPSIKPPRPTPGWDKPLPGGLFTP